MKTIEPAFPDLFNYPTKDVLGKFPASSKQRQNKSTKIKEPITLEAANALADQLTPFKK